MFLYRAGILSGEGSDHVKAGGKKVGLFGVFRCASRCVCVCVLVRFVRFSLDLKFRLGWGVVGWEVFFRTTIPNPSRSIRFIRHHVQQ